MFINPGNRPETGTQCEHLWTTCRCSFVPLTNRGWDGTCGRGTLTMMMITVRVMRMTNKMAKVRLSTTKEIHEVGGVVGVVHRVVHIGGLYGHVI